MPGEARVRAFVPAPTPSTTLNLDRLEHHYRSVLSGARICQLYAFLLLFELLTIALAFAIHVLGWAVGAGLASASGMEPATYIPYEFSQSRTLAELFFLANVWLIYWFYADFRRGYWILALCTMGLAHNVKVTYDAAFIVNGGFTFVLEGFDLGPESVFFRYVFFVGVAASHAYFLYIAARGQYSIHALTRDEARSLSEFRPSEPSGTAALFAMTNVPPTLRYSRRKVMTAVLQILAGVANFTNYWIGSMAFLALCSAPFLVTMFATPVGNTYTALQVQGVTREWLLAAGLLVGVFFLVVVVFFASPVFVTLLGRVSLWLSRRTMRKSLHQIQGEDSRAPILFLRSFLDDQVDLSSRRLVFEQWLLDGASRSMTLDYLILGEGTAYGPTVALGNPDDATPPYGIARGYFEHATWKSAVAELCDRSAAIIMVLDATEGVEWEVGHIVSKHFLARSLILLGPADIGAERGRMLLEKTLERCTEAVIDLPAAGSPPYEHVLGFWCDRRGQVELLTSSRPAVYTYLVAVRLFLRSRLEQAPHSTGST